MGHYITRADMLAAAEWLLTYEAIGDDAVASSCHKVARWLEDQVKIRQRESMIRDTMTRHDVSRHTARKAVDSILTKNHFF